MDSIKNYHIFENSYKQFAKGVFRFIYFKVSDYELAKDLTADTFIRYWKVLKQGDEIKNTKALTYEIANGIVIDYYRRKKEKNHVSFDAIDERLLGAFEDLEESIDLKKKVKEVFVVIKSIRKEYQDVLLLRYVEDLTIKEIAQVLKKKENATRVLLHRALKTVKEKL